MKNRILWLVALILVLVVPCGVSATVSDATYKSTSVCNGTATSYTFTFGVGATSEVKVTTTVSSTGVETILAETTDYSVSCTNSDCTSGGTVVLTSGSKCPSGSTLTLEMNVPYTQTSDFTEGMPTLYETFEDGLDKLTRITQQLKGRVEDAETDIASVTPATATGVYYYRLADYGSISSAVSAIGTERAVLLCDSAITMSDDPTVLSTTTFQAVQGCMITTTSHTLTINGTIVAGPYQIFSGSGTVLGLNEINAKWFGATGDGTTDDTTTLQAAFTAWSSYSTLTIPKGAYKITSPITRTGLVYANLNFEGGAYIYASASGGVALTNFTHAKINGVDIRRSVLDWATDDTGLSFNGSASSIDINYITSFNKGFKLVGGSCHYNTIRFQRMMDNKFPIYVYSSNSTTEAVNNNTFYGGRLALSSATKAATSGSYGIYMDVVKVSNLRFRDITIETMHGGIYGYGSGHMFDSLYFEGVDNYWFTGEIWNSVFIVGRWYNSTGKIEGYDSSKMDLSHMSRNNVWIGKDNDTQMSLLMETQYGGIGFVDIYGRNVIHQLVSYRLINSLIFTDAAGVNQYFNKQYYSDNAEIPSSGSYRKGAVVWNNDPDAGEKIGIICDTSGTMGTLSGVTFTGTSGDTFGTVNTTTGLYVGAYISIVGVTGTKTVMGIDGTTVHLSAAIDATVTDAAVAYVAATWLDIAAQVSYRSGAGDPTGSVTPKFIGEEWLNTTGNHWYKAHGLTSSDWTALN